MKEKHIRNIKLTVNIEDFDSVLNGINVFKCLLIITSNDLIFFSFLCVCACANLFKKKEKLVFFVSIFWVCLHCYDVMVANTRCTRFLRGSCGWVLLISCCVCAIDSIKYSIQYTRLIWSLNRVIFHKRSQKTFLNLKTKMFFSVSVTYVETFFYSSS